MARDRSFGSPMDSVEPRGHLASARVLTTFRMRAMLPLRAEAIASKVAFSSYGLLACITSVLLLHFLQLPLNLFRAAQSLRDRGRRNGPDDGASAKGIGSGCGPTRPAGVVPPSM